MKKNDKNLDDVLTGILVYCVLSFLWSLWVLALNFSMGDTFLKATEVYRSTVDPLSRLYFDNLRPIAIVRFLFSTGFMVVAMLTVRRNLAAFRSLKWILVISIFIRFIDLGWVVYDHYVVRSQSKFLEELKMTSFVSGWFYFYLAWSAVLAVFLVWARIYLNDKAFAKSFK